MTDLEGRVEERLIKVKDEALAALVGRIHGGKERMGLSVLRGRSQEIVSATRLALHS